MKGIVLLLATITSSISADIATQNLTRYLMANYYQFGNDLKNAGYWYGQITPAADSEYVYAGYIPYLAASQSFGDIVKLIPELDNRFKNNQEMQILFATALEQMGKKNEAHTRLIMLNEQNKANQELAFKVVQIYLERSEPENALQVIKNMLNNSARRPNNFIFLFMESQIYLQLNKKPEALAAIKQCIEAYPKFDKSWLLYAALHEQEGKIEEAIKGYTTFLEVSAQPNIEIERHLTLLAYRQKIAQQKNIIDPKRALTDAIALMEKKEYQNALACVDRYLSHAPTDMEARLLKIQILAQQKNFDKAVALVEQWMLSDQDYEPWLKTIHLLSYFGLSYETAITSIEKIEKQKGSRLALHLYKADLALRTAHPHKALPALQKAYDATSQDLLKSQIALQIALIYFDQKKWNLAQKTLEDALKNKIEYAPAHNLLAHLYATKNKNIQKAEHHIAHALKKDPSNPHFLDTKALILYKEQKFEEAIALLQTVAQAHPTDYSIICHLGKCYYKNGNTTKAIDTMKAAIHIAKNDQDKAKAESRIKLWNKS